MDGVAQLVGEVESERSVVLQSKGGEGAGEDVGFADGRGGAEDRPVGAPVGIANLMAVNDRAGAVVGGDDIGAVGRIAVGGTHYAERELQSAAQFAVVVEAGVGGVGYNLVVVSAGREKLAPAVEGGSGEVGVYCVEGNPAACGFVDNAVEGMLAGV